MLVKVVVIFVLFFAVARSQEDDDCLCDDPNSGSMWIGLVVPFGDCIGQCDNARRLMGRRCSSPSTGTPDTRGEALFCRFSINCTNPCEGNWSLWGSNEQCSNSCGVGRKMQSRTCYRPNPRNQMAPFRTTQCEGSNGEDHQTRYISCHSVRDCSRITTPSMNTPTTFSSSSTASRIITTLRQAPTPSPTSTIEISTIRSRERASTTAKTPFSSTTSPQTTSPQATPPPSSSLNHDRTSSTTTPTLPQDSKTRSLPELPSVTTRAILIDKITSEKTTSTASHTPISASAMSELTLPLILCSVAIICVAVIISIVIIVRRKPHEQIQHIVLDSSNTITKDNNNDDEKKEFHNYEVVGPALPPSRKPTANSETKNNDISLNVHNVLYSKDGNDENASLKYSSSPTMEDYDDPGYLTPLNTSAPKEQKKTPPSKIRAQSKELVAVNGLHANSKVNNCNPVQQKTKNEKQRSPILQSNIPKQPQKLHQDVPFSLKPLIVISGQIPTASDLRAKPTVVNIASPDEIPKPKEFLADSRDAEITNINNLLHSQNRASVPNKPPVEGDYVKDISILMRPKSEPKSSNRDLSELGYVTVEQLKNRNLM